MQTNGGQVSELMDKLRQGDKEAAGQLVAMFYPELRRLARSRMRGERARHTWQPTVLVNQLYLELLKVKGLRKDDADEDAKAAFLRLAAHLMRRLLIHHARPLARKMEVAPVAGAIEIQVPADEDLRVVEDTLLDLERIDPIFRTITEMKVLEGLSMEEIAAELEIPLRTVYRRWTFIREWLATHLSTLDG